MGAIAVALGVLLGFPAMAGGGAAQQARHGLFAFSLRAETQNERGATENFYALKVGLLLPDGSTRMIADGQTPAFSPNGRVIAISHEWHAQVGLSSPSGIVLHRLDGTPIRRLTRGEDVSPTWSPSGRRLAFTRLRCVGNRACIFTIGRDGHDKRLLVKEAYSPSWSADGQIAFERYNSANIWVTTPRGRNTRPVTHFDRDGARGWDQVSEPDWSPSGNTLLFGRFRYRRDASPRYASGIAVINEDGTHLRWVQKLGSVPSSPTWSPNGRRISFEYANDNIYAISATGTSPRVKLMPFPPFETWCARCQGRSRVITHYEGSDWQPVVRRRPTP